MAIFSKVGNITINLLPFGLLFWGFYSMLHAVVEGQNTSSIYNWVDTNCMQDTPNPNVVSPVIPEMDAHCIKTEGEDFNVWDLTVKSDKYIAKQFNSSMMGFAAFWGLLCMVWALITLCYSGALGHSFDTLGYHIKSNRVTKLKPYKYMSYLVTGVFACLSAYGLVALATTEQTTTGKQNEWVDSAEESFQQQKMAALGAFFNGIFQVGIALLALVIPAPDTVEFGEDTMKVKCKASFYATSRAVVENYQDALMAGRCGELQYLRDLVDADDMTLHKLTQDSKALKHPGPSMMAGFCGGKPKEAERRQDGSNIELGGDEAPPTPSMSKC